MKLMNREIEVFKNAEVLWDITPCRLIFTGASEDLGISIYKVFTP